MTRDQWKSVLALVRAYLTYPGPKGWGINAMALSLLVSFASVVGAAASVAHFLVRGTWPSGERLPMVVIATCLGFVLRLAIDATFEWRRSR